MIYHEAGWAITQWSLVLVSFENGLNLVTDESAAGRIWCTNRADDWAVDVE